MEKIIIYILTHKKYQEEYDPKLYKPLLNGSHYHSETFNYIKDDTGDNISELNTYYAELTGQYWAWKNSDADIIGFVHYRRWFARDVKFNKLTKNDILHDLKKHDIILPQKTRLIESLEKTIVKGLKKRPDYGAKWEDYIKLGNILKTHYQEYYKSYEEIMKNKECYNNNMFICNFKIANEYFSWVFDVLNMMKYEIDFSKYPENNKRVLGFFSEVLLTVFVHKHDLKVKERPILFSDRNLPIVHVIERRFPRASYIEKIIWKMLH